MPSGERRRTPGPTLCEYTNGPSEFEGQKNLSGTPARLHWAAILLEACKSQLPVLIHQDEVASASKIRNSVTDEFRWDGYHDSSNLPGCFDVAKEHRLTHAFDKVLTAVQDEHKAIQDQGDPYKFGALLDQLEKLDATIMTFCKHVAAEAAKKLPDNFTIPEAAIKRLARKFEDEKKKDCVVIAPDLWLPVEL